MTGAHVDGTAARPLTGQSRPRRAAASRRPTPLPASSGTPAPSTSSQTAVPGRLTAGQVVLFAACWLGIVTGAVAVVARQADIAAAGYRISDARAELATVERENLLLEADVALLADPERIYRLATTELGMVPRERFEVTVVAAAEPVARAGKGQAALASLGAEAAELAAQEGLWAGLGRAVVGWLTGQSQRVAAQGPDH